MTPPWRAQDIPDRLMGHNTRPVNGDGMALIDELSETEFAVGDHDFAIVMWLPLDEGRVQPVIWPMTLVRLIKRGRA